MKRYTLDELHAFLGRVDSYERATIAADYINRIDYLTNEEWDELMRSASYLVREWNHIEREERRGRNYSPSCPWNAPGMRASDFIR